MVANEVQHADIARESIRHAEEMKRFLDQWDLICGDKDVQARGQIRRYRAPKQTHRRVGIERNTGFGAFGAISTAGPAAENPM